MSASPTQPVKKPGMTPWQTLNCEDGSAIVIPDDHTDKVFALIELLSQEYGGDWSADNPVIVEAAQECRIEVWRSYLKRDLENSGIDLADSYWGTDGSGAKWITVLWCLRSTWVLGDEAAAVEPKSEAS